MLNNETFRRGKKLDEEVKRLRRVLEAIRNGAVPNDYRYLKATGKVARYLERRLSDG